MTTADTTLVGSRRCLHCTVPVIPVAAYRAQIVDAWTGEREGSNVAAWLNGYCTPMCQRNYALTAVSTGRAWWLRSVQS